MPGGVLSPDEVRPLEDAETVPLVLALEPDVAQGILLRHVVCDRVSAELVIVPSKIASLEALAGRVPDVVLIGVRFTPRDETDLTDRLKKNGSITHVQTIRFARLTGTPAGAPKKKRGLLGALSGESVPLRSGGCSPASLAKQITEAFARAEKVEGGLVRAPRAGDGTGPPSRSVRTGRARRGSCGTSCRRRARGGVRARD